MSFLFITLEGSEGAGKTTQVRELQEFLLAQGHDVLATHEPGGTQLGKGIRHILLHTEGEQLSPLSELFLLMSDRAQHIETVIKPALAAKMVVISDRFSDSTFAYQGYGHGIDRGLIRQLNWMATGGITPSLTFWLDIDVQTGLDRTRQNTIKLDRIEKMDISFHQRVREGFRSLWQQHTDRIIRIDASQSPQAVSEQIQNCWRDRFRN